MSVKNMLVTLTPGLLKPYWGRLEASDVGYRLARGAFWSIAGGMISRVFALISSIIIARLLGKETFGELGTLQITFVMFTVFASFGTGATSTKYVAEFRLNDPVKARRIIAISNAAALTTGGMAAVVMFVTSHWLARVTLAAPHLSGSIRAGSVLLVLAAINGSQTGALAGFEAFRKIALLNFVSGVASFPLTVAGTYWKGLAGAVWGLVLTNTVACALGHILLRRELQRARLPLKAEGWVKEWPVLWKFSVPILLANLMVGPVNWACTAILIHAPGGYSEMGAFSAANQWFNALLIVPILVSQTVLPIMAERFGNSDRIKNMRLLRLSIKLNAALTAPIVVLMLVSPFIMQCYGKGFKQEWPTLCLVLITAGILSIQTPIGQTIVASGNIWPGFLMNSAWAAVYLAATMSLVGLGASGLAGARLIAYLSHATWTYWYATKILREK